MKRFNSFILCFFIILFSSCGRQESLEGFNVQSLYPLSTSTNYFKNTSEIIIEVYYEEGAEPYTGNRNNGEPLWGILEDNLNAIFQYRSIKPDIIIPTDISKMNKLTSFNKSKWSVENVLDLNSKYKLQSTTKDKAIFYIYFLNGNAESGNNIIGFNINRSPVIAIFKDVIKMSGSEYTKRFVEQSTLVHEMGHALGFVNNGVPLSQNHQDQEHGAHTVNDECVMYWMNEGTSDLISYVQKYIASGSTVMWGKEVLDDAKNFSQ